MLGEIDTVDPYTPIRWWLYNEMKQAFPSSDKIITSNGDPALFQKWTGTTQSYLKSQWDSGSRFTTCNSFLNQVANNICRAGKLPLKTLHSFNLPIEKGWHWYPDSDSEPQAGDFFQFGTRGGTYEHVGLVFDRVGDMWTTIESGQGGPNAGFDMIKRKGPNPFPNGHLMGWINIEEYFEGWEDPGTY
jgi:hypothetical protein